MAAGRVRGKGILHLTKSQGSRFRWQYFKMCLVKKETFKQMMMGEDLDVKLVEKQGKAFEGSVDRMITSTI